MLKVIIAEDEISQRESLTHLLESEGYSVVATSNGKSTLKQLKKDIEIRVLITDLQMPDMSGFDLIRSVRANQSLYVYIIVVSSTYDKTSMLKALKLGADDFLAKPVHPE